MGWGRLVGEGGGWVEVLSVDTSLTELGTGGMCLRVLLCLEGEARPDSAMPTCYSFHAGSPVLEPPVALALQHIMGYFF